MKNKYKVVALVPLEFSVEGNSDSKKERSSRVFALTKFTSNQLLVSAFLTA